MANNKFTRTIDSTVIKNKLDALSKILQESNASKDLVTFEQVLAEAVRALSLFFKDIASPTFDPRLILAGDAPDPEDYNSNLQEILDDLTIMFKELENVEALVLENFNYFVSESNRLNRKMKSVSSKLGDFILFSTNASKDAIFYTDSFNNLDRVDLNSRLINTKQAEVSQAEGIATLPIERTPESLITVEEPPVINDNSNGVAGNNFEISAARNDDISDILDNNADTWFEYERVISAINDDGTPLTLDITMNLGEAKIVNFIRVNPNNFGTRTQIEIETIETSEDGSTFINIKDEVPIPGFQATDEPNIFTLAPATSKFSGQGLYTFTPRVARYIHFTFKQITPYVIDTLAGSRLRYAIGIRDIEVQAVRYEAEGEFISRPFTNLDEVRKLILSTGQNPTEESELVSIKHEVSPDNGITWHEIRPKEFTGLSDVVNAIPEILDFNSGLEDSIDTDTPVNAIRYRATLKRNSEAFKAGASALRKSIRFTTELHQFPSTSPFNIELEKPPVKGSLCLIDPHFGSRGLDDLRYELATGNTSVQIHSIPFSKIPLDKVKSTLSNGVKAVTEVSPIQLYINGEQWSQVSQGGLSTATASDKFFEVDHEKGIIRTGDGRSGRAPVAGGTLAIAVTPELLFPSTSEEGHISTLSFPTNGDEQSAIIRRFEPRAEASETLDKSVTRSQLSNVNIVVGSLRFTSGSTIFVTEVSSEAEVNSVGEFFIDYEEAILTSFTPTSASIDTGVSYQYDPVTILDTSEWFYKDSTSCANRDLIVKDSAWLTIPVEDEVLPSGVNKFTLDNFNVDKGSITFTVPSGVTDPFVDEVEFVDGRTEILGLIEATEVIPNGILTASGIQTFTLSLVAADTTVHPVIFSNRDVFVEDVTNTKPSPTLVGEYLLAGDFRTVKVHIDEAVTKPGSVTYFYSDPTKSPIGTFSVNYLLGDIYTFESMPSADITAKYQFAHFEISYPIARVVPEVDFEVDSENGVITIEDREIIRRMQIPIGNRNTLGTRNTYQVLYNYVDESRSNVSDLEPHFTPILKDYALKVLTKGRIV